MKDCLKITIKSVSLKKPYYFRNGILKFNSGEKKIRNQVCACLINNNYL